MANSMFKFTLPAQAMRFADDNIRVGKQSTAKDALQWFMGQRRLNKQFTPDHEALAIKFVDLAVDLKDAYSSKDGLINFRYLTQQHNPAALDRVVRRLITRALSKARDARDAAAGSVDLAAVDDLDAEQTPEELLMSSMTSEGAAERAQRELVVPWVRHAWDVCKNTLDTLRNIPKLEEAYQYAAFQAFDFCAEFGRTTEFRKLCESMRKHLNHWRNDFQKWDMSEADPRFTLDNLERHMSTRFTQLSHCANLSMWSEGFRTVEDIFALVRLAPEEPAPALMAQYYDNLAKIFWKSDDLLFHAYATLQHFRVLAAQKGVATVASGTGAATGAGTGGSTPPEVTHLANQLVCAALCIPLFADAHSEDERFFHMDFDRDKKDRLARLLNFAETPSRDALLAKLGHLGVARLASPEVGGLLNNLEGAFHPLEMVASVQPALATATSTPALVEYVPALEKLVLYRLLGQLTQVYSFITMDFFDGLVAPLKLSGEALELEIARGCKAMLLQVRLDHCGRCIRLGRESMESDRMRSQLTSLATALADIVPSLPADSGRAGMADLLATKRDQVFKHAKESEDGTLEENLGRIKEIEARREKQAREAEVKRRLAEAEAAAAAARQAEHEAARVAAEKRRREAEKTKLIEEEMHLAEMRSMLKDMGQDPAAKTRAELLALTADQLEAEAYAKETSAAKAAEDRRFKRSQELTFLTRALREREQDEMIAWVDARLDTDGEYATKQQELVRARSEKLHAETLIVKARLARMMPFLDTFEENVLSARQTQHALALEERLAKARAAALQGKVERAMRAKVAKETADEMEREAERQRRVADAERKRREEDARAAAAADAERFAKVRDRVESQLEAGGSKPAFGQQRADADMDFGKFRSGGPSTAAVPPPSGNLRGGHSSSWTPSAPSTREAGRGGWGSGARTGGAFGSKDQDVRASGGRFGSGSGSGGFGSRGPPRSSGGFRRDEDRKPSGGGGDGGGWRR